MKANQLHLPPQSINKSTSSSKRKQSLELASIRKENATVQDGRVVVQDVRGRTSETKNPGQAKTQLCANNLQRNRAHSKQKSTTKASSDQTTFKGQEAAMNAYENGVELEEEQLVVLEGRTGPQF
ncbi:hypothetical protein Tco_1429947 [Tanacetum coccineum]